MFYIYGHTTLNAFSYGKEKHTKTSTIWLISWTARLNRRATLIKNACFMLKCKVTIQQPNKGITTT